MIRGHIDVYVCMCVFMCVCMYKLVRFNGESLLQSPILAVSVDKEVGWD